MPRAGNGRWPTSVSNRRFDRRSGVSSIVTLRTRCRCRADERPDSTTTRMGPLAPLPSCRNCSASAKPRVWVRGVSRYPVAARPERTTGSGHARLEELLGSDLSRSSKGTERALSEASVAGKSVECATDGARDIAPKIGPRERGLRFRRSLQEKTRVGRIDKYPRR